MNNVIKFNKPAAHMHSEGMYFVDAIDHFHRGFEPLSLLEPGENWKPILFYGGFLDDLNYYPTYRNNKWSWVKKDKRNEEDELNGLITYILKVHDTTEHPFPHFYIRESYEENSEIITVFHIKNKTYRKYLLPDIKHLLETFEITPEKPVGSYREEASILGIGREKYLNKFFKYFKDITDDEYHMSELLNTVIQTYEFSKHTTTLLQFAE